MAFFEKLTDAVTNTGAAVGNKAKELTEIAKIKNEITTQERKIKEEYEKIGKLYVEHYADNAEELFIDSISKITLYQKTIEKKKLELNEVKKVKVCPGCGATVEETSAFCSKCGQKVG